MKDVTSTSFGLLIAFLIPGVFMLGAASLHIEYLKTLLALFLKSETNVGSFLLYMILSLAAGLELTALRWLLYEKWHKNKLKRSDFNLLSDEKLNSFRAAVDEHYRYHQFWGNMSIVIPFYILWVFESVKGCGMQVLFIIIIILIDILTIFAAKDSLINYVERSQNILKGE